MLRATRSDSHRLSIVTVLALLTSAPAAQTPAPTPQPAAGGRGGAQDMSQVEIRTTRVAVNLHMLEGQGGTIGVLTGTDGAFMVDAQFAPLSEKIAAAVKAIQPDGRIRFLVNTHLHGDHTGGNENFARMGATIFSREQLRARLARPNPQANGQPGVPAPAAALPLVTYDAPVTLQMNGETVRLIPLPVAHTDGDTMVHFTNADVIMTGDVYRSTGYPNIDRANGGTLKGLLDSIMAIATLAKPTTKILPGHGAIVDKTAVLANHAMIVAVRDKVDALVKQNKTQEEVIASKPTADWDARVAGATAMTADRFVGQLYQELTVRR